MEDGPSADSAAAIEQSTRLKPHHGRSPVPERVDSRTLNSFRNEFNFPDDRTAPPRVQRDATIDGPELEVTAA
jgi:hypothetical protein